jgi:hypothetical protein
MHRVLSEFIGSTLSEVGIGRFQKEPEESSSGDPFRDFLEDEQNAVEDLGHGLYSVRDFVHIGTLEEAEAAALAGKELYVLESDGELFVFTGEVTPFGTGLFEDHDMGGINTFPDVPGGTIVTSLDYR